MQPRRLGSILLLLLSAILVVGMIAPPEHIRAQTTDEIQRQIDAHNQKIKDLAAEIATYQKQLDALGTQHATLATSIQSLDVTRKQLTAKIASLQKQISALNLELKQLGYQIQDKQKAINLNKATLAKSLREISQTDSASIVEQVLSSKDFGDAWGAIDANISLNSALQSQTRTLARVKNELTAQQQAVTKTQAQLVSVTTDLGTQKKAVDVTVSQKSQLLAQTKSQESAYQKLIATKRAQQKVFEQELNKYEAQLKSVSNSAIPHAGSGILAWPYSESFAGHCVSISKSLGNSNCVTQYFGNTAFAASGAYNGNGHNGIDFGMPVGTPVMASLGGTVLATGNTDLQPGCYSFGKWVMVKHANGLATMYAHLSSIQVSSGQSVDTGTVVGYSGMTGYATGPHLHYGVYASAGVQITTLAAARRATSPCANASMPVAPLNAYLNPLNYL